MSERVWMKSAIVEREVGDVAEERRLLAEGLDKFPTAWKVSYFFIISVWAIVLTACFVVQLLQVRAKVQRFFGVSIDGRVAGRRGGPRV